MKKSKVFEVKYDQNLMSPKQQTSGCDLTVYPNFEMIKNNSKIEKIMKTKRDKSKKVSVRLNNLDYVRF